MIITKNNYEQQLKKVSDENKTLSEEFLSMLEKLNVQNLNIASVGNSISAGYSKCDEILPLFMRSHIYDSSDQINYFSYSRIRRNEDINILRWYQSNISHQLINNLNIDDIAVKQNAYVDKYWSSQTLENYRKMASTSDLGFKDFNLLDNSIIVYNGFTGEFTNAIRKGDSKEKLKLFSTFKRDIENAKLVLTQFYLDNPNTQVYVCGLPNIMGTGIISVLDRQIRKICERIPNTVYLPGTVRNALFYLDGQKGFDIHYSKPEYIILLNNIIKAMNNNYVSQQFVVSLISKLKEYSLLIEKESTTSKGCPIEVSKIIDTEFEKHAVSLESAGVTKDMAVDKVLTYYNNNYLSTFPCTSRETVIRKLSHINNK